MIATLEVDWVNQD